MKTNKILLNSIESLQPEKGHYSRYQAYNKIGLKGQRPVEERYDVYGLGKYINKQSVVLDVGSNIGCLSLHIAEKAREVDGIEHYKNYVTISNKIKQFLNTKNCNFYNSDMYSFSKGVKYDFIVALAVHPSSIKGFRTFTKEVVLRLLKKGGHLLIESRNFRKRDTRFEDFILHLISVGLVERNSGICQCENERGELNQKRKFYILERK